jgi:hypothetical protein
MNSAAARGVIVPKISGRPVQKMKRVNPALSAPRSILERLSFASYQPKVVRHADVCPVSSSSAIPEYHKATDAGSEIEVKPCNDPKGNFFAYISQKIVTWSNYRLLKLNICFQNILKLV